MPDAADKPSKLLTDADFERAASALQCEVAAIRAVSEIESRGSGFLLDGVTPTLLYEAHIFHARTGGTHTATHPGISSRNWNRSLYAIGRDADERGFREHQRLQLAVSLNRSAALESASWGRFQIMGFNWATAGCASLQDFINAMYRSEGAQLGCFISFLLNTKRGLAAVALREHRWLDFADLYNGPSSRANNYGPKIAAAYDRWSRA